MNAQRHVHRLLLITVIVAVSGINSVRAQTYQHISGFSEQVNAKLESFFSESPKIKTRKVAVFDCDGTLLSQVPYYLADEALYDYAKKNYAGKEDSLSIAKMKIVEEMLHGNNVAHVYVESRIRFFAGLTPSALENIGKDYYNRNYQGKFYPEMKPLIANLNRFGFEVWVITASPEFLYQGFVSEELDIPKNRIIGVKSVVRNGVTTDELVVPTPQDAGKAETIETYIKEKPLLVVGNSRSDMEMMNTSVGLKMIVNPDDIMVRGTQTGPMNGFTVESYWEKEGALIIYCNDIRKGNHTYVSDEWGVRVNQATLRREFVHSYSFKRVFEVEGRQGIATDGQYYYISGSKALYKYSADGTVVLKNVTPFASFDQPSNHIGDIDVYNGEIFAGCETFIDGRGTNIQIAIYDAETLNYKRSMNWFPDSGQVEVSGITVDTDRETVWMTDWVNGCYIYQYDLTTGKYLRKIHLEPVLQYQQGIKYWEGHLYITADDGDAEHDEDDHMYRVKPSASRTAAQVVLEKTFSEFTRTGEIEGLTVDRTTGELMVLSNRGRRIILGMPKGFYPGYDREIHEVYVYSMSNH